MKLPAKLFASYVVLVAASTVTLVIASLRGPQPCTTPRATPARFEPFAMKPHRL